MKKIDSAYSGIGNYSSALEWNYKVVFLIIAHLCQRFYFFVNLKPRSNFKLHHVFEVSNSSAYFHLKRVKLLFSCYPRGSDLNQHTRRQDSFSFLRSPVQTGPFQFKNTNNFFLNQTN